MIALHSNKVPSERVDRIKSRGVRAHDVFLQTRWASINLFSAVDNMKVGQAVVATEHSRDCQITNLELRRSAWNRLESLTTHQY